MWIAMSWLFHLSLIFHIILLSSFISLASPSSLYDSHDPLSELNGKNFAHTIFGKSNVWVIEFYNVWCGHCIRYAPVWKEFARHVKTWKNAVKVAVVNCADSENLKLCRDYDVNSYPTIKIFQANIKENEKGKILDGNRDVASLEVSIIDFLEKNWNENQDAKWPSIKPLENNSIKNVFTTMNSPSEDIILFIESEDSYIGRKVIMDISIQNKVFHRVLTTNTRLLSDLKTTILNSSNLTVLKIQKNGKEESLFRFSKDSKESDIRDVMFEYFNGYPRNKSDDVDSKTASVSKDSSKQNVSMVDLENALHNALNQEIGMVKNIDGPRLDALKDFLYILKSYFPGSSSVKLYLSKVYDFAANVKNITGEAFISSLEQMQDDQSYLPKMRDWVSCKGSENRFRGYPCSLWTLFHTLSVEGYNAQKNVKNRKNDEEVDVLQTIRAYVKHFFGCSDCSQHFQKMAENSEETVRTPRDTVLWLWRAHNQVNNRLAGDLTEDPEHPKVQFPSKSVCPKCRTEDSESADKIKWDEDAVIEFLRHFYGKENIVNSPSDEDPSSVGTKSTNSAMRHKPTRRPLSGHGRFNMRRKVEHLQTRSD